MHVALGHRRHVLTALVAAGFVVCSGSALAQDPPRPAPQAPVQTTVRMDMGQRAHARQDSSERSLSDAVRRVQRSTGGHILGAERVPYDGRDINRVKYMDERGRVRYMDDPAPARSQPRGPRADDTSLRGDNP